VDAVLRVDQWPELRQPVMVFAFTGWVDAGFAGSGTIAALGEELGAARKFASIDLSELLDLQQTRPTVRIAEGGVRAIDWPTVELWAGNAGRDVVLVHGPEPSLRWASFSAEIADAAQTLGVTLGISVGGMPVLASHRHPVSVFATATSRSFAQELGALRPDYTGPTGLNTVLQHQLGQRGIPAFGFWAQVPQYVAGSPSPPAVRALLARIVELGQLTIDLDPLDARCEEYTARVEEGLSQRQDVAELVERLEQATGGIPSGDELVSEIERFLRSQPDQDEQ
jgi:predicted ATP-grasp superfamily ATP-dependent carboligase